MSRRHLVIAALAALVAGIALLFFARSAAGEGLDFMPRGGQALLLKAVGSDAAALREATAGKRDEAQWRAWLEPRKGLTERERDTLAAYLAVNMPLADAALQSPDLAAALPADGRALAENECQSCHSLFSSYLTQSRDAQGWRNIFLSPFHRQIKLDLRQREEFARYSALNMPMKVDDVPQDMRF